VRLCEYIQAVESGAIASAAPGGGDYGAPQYYDAHEASRGAANNNYARSEGQARARSGARRKSTRILGL
jgi:hypothetical protein